MAKKSNTDKASKKEPKSGEPSYGRELQMGMIVRLKSPETSFEEALAAGPDSAFDYFGDILQGLRVGHIKALRKLRFFEMVEERIGVPIDVGSWEEVKTDEMEDLVKIIKKLKPSAEEGIQELFDDMLDFIKVASDQDCSIGFMLSDDELMSEDDEEEGAEGDDDDWRKPDPDDDAGDWEPKFEPADFDDFSSAGPIDFDDDFGGGGGGGFDDFGDFGGGGGTKKKKKK